MPPMLRAGRRCNLCPPQGACEPWSRLVTPVETAQCNRTAEDMLIKVLLMTYSR